MCDNENYCNVEDQNARCLKTYICGCVKNCDQHLHKVFENINQIIELFDDYHILIAFDTSSDKSLRTLCDIKKQFPNEKFEILINRNSCSSIRTQNIANARNKLVNAIYEKKTTDKFKDFEYFIMMDMDDVCAVPMDITVLQKYIDYEYANTPLPWDALSFNRPGYYDAWALSVKPYVFSCWNFPKGREVVIEMRKYINELLIQTDKVDPAKGLLPVMSAFNGFAIYRISKFDRVQYEWNIYKNIEIIPISDINTMAQQVKQPIAYRVQDDDCEHRYFHIRATQLNGARICISPKCLFTEYIFA